MNLLCLGDSLTYGYDVACEWRWTTRLAKQTGIAVVNEGLCGDTTGGMLYRLQHMNISRFDAFFFMGGSNDILMDIPVGQMQNHITEIADLLQQEGKPVYIGIPILTKPESAVFGWQGRDDVARHNEDLRSHRQWLLQLTAQRGFTAVDFYDALRQTELQQESSLYADGVHPNEAGYAVMAELAAACFGSIC